MLNEYVLLTDDSCDLPRSYLDENNIGVMQLSFTLDNIQYYAYDLPPQEFYAKVRGGVMPITAQVNVDQAIEMFEKILKSGKDILNIAFSSGLSGTCNSMQVAATELAQSYPERKIVVVDSLCASLGQGLLVHKACELKKKGKSLEEVAQWVKDNRLKVCHNFTVDDLMHLHRGGRVSKASAIAGTMLGIKPALHVDDEGHLINISKVRGRKQSLIWLVDRMVEHIGYTENDIFMVSHGDCIDDANFVADLVKKRVGITNCLINYVGPVIGAHSGPGTVALFFMAEDR